jgi:hypothetical protein
MEKTITLHKQFGSLIITRKTIAEFFSNLTKMSEDKIVLNFNNIKFISRSAAHEYIRQKSISNKEIRETNIGTNIQAMFMLVAKQLSKIATKP